MKIPDRTLVGNRSHVLFEVFNPPWWRLDRWVWWWLFARDKCELTFFDFGSECTLRASKAKVQP